MSVKCPICNRNTESRPQVVRSGKEMILNHCESCNFDFFDKNPTEDLIKNKLDESRLKAAGLEIPDVDEDFANGLRQSQPYIDKYITNMEKNRNILEIGCSWGYFLKLVQDKGAHPYGIELNELRTHYVTKKLGITCFPNLEECEQSGIRFKQIFLFYVLEYVNNPVEYLARLVHLLDEDGHIIIITPNLSDVLKDVWSNEAFKKFFYDEHAINYFSPSSLHKVMGRLSGTEFQGGQAQSLGIAADISTVQGYSFINQAGWYLNNAPRTTGMVGGDYYLQGVLARLRNASPEFGKLLAEKLENFDGEYRKLITENEFGNQIHIDIHLHKKG